MRHTRVAIGLLFLAAFALLVSGPVAAVTEPLSPGEVFTRQVTVSDNDLITYQWTSTDLVVFVFRDPDGVEIDSGTDDTGYGIHTADMGGTYTLTWTNNQLGTVSLDYTITETPFGDATGIFEDIWYTIIIAAVIIVVVIVVIIVLVVYVLGKDKKKQAAPQYGVPPMQMGPPGAPLTNCPRCGVPLDPNGAFCQKCGARVR